jgi:hypothetical protein
LAAIKGEKTLTELAEQFDVHANQITQWKSQLLEGAAGVFGGEAKAEAATAIGAKGSKEPLHRCLISQRPRKCREFSPVSIRIKSRPSRNSAYWMVYLVSEGRLPASRDTTPPAGPVACGVGRG